MTVTTPTVRQASRRGLFWILGGAFLAVVAIVTMILTGASGPGGTPLSAENAGPAGSKAIAAVLRGQGVTVIATDSLRATRDAVGSAGDTTLFLYDAEGRLDENQLKSAAALADRVVLMTPNFDALQALAPAVALAGAVDDGALRADCDLPAVTRAGAVSGGGSGYRGKKEATGATGCLGSDDNVVSLVRLADGGRQLTVVGTSDAFANEHVAERGNAALALGLLGEASTLVWYLPSLADVGGGTPSLGELTPPWVTPVMALLFCVAIAAAIWRGRRMGPLIVENLPVVVKASETMEGRARLYQRASARLRALDALRIGAIGRLAAQCGLPRTATVDDVIAAVSELTETDRAAIRALLVDDRPETDRDLIRLSDALLELERTVTATVRPGGARIQGE